jgi:hypothetical protein
MRILPKDRHWSGWALFPFRAYLCIAPVCLFVWKFATEGHRPKGALAEAVTPVFLGCLICILVFVLAAAILFFTNRRKLVAENLMYAGIAMLIGFLIAPMAAAS